MSKKVYWIVSAIMILTMLVGISSCAPAAPAEVPAAAPAEEAEAPAEEKPMKIAYLAQSAFANDFTLSEYYGVVDSIKAAGYEPVVYNPDFDGAEQINMMEDAIAQGELAGIILHPIDSTLIVSAIEKANAAGIPVVNIVAGSEGGDVLITVRNDTAAEGSNACEVIVAGLQEKYGEVRGKVLEVHGGLQDDVAKGRSAGFMECIEDYPNVTVVTTSADGWSLTLAESGTRDALTANPDVDAIYSHADYFNDAIEAGLVAANKLFPRPDPNHIIWTSIDGAGQALDRIRAGIMDQTSANPNYAYGEWAVKFLMDYLNEGTVPVIGTVYEDPNTAWSPARVEEGSAGPHMVMTPFNVTPATVDAEFLWGNQTWVKPE